MQEYNYLTQIPAIELGNNKNSWKQIDLKVRISYIKNTLLVLKIKAIQV